MRRPSPVIAINGNVSDLIAALQGGGGNQSEKETPSELRQSLREAIIRMGTPCTSEEHSAQHEALAKFLEAKLSSMPIPPKLQGIWISLSSLILHHDGGMQLLTDEKITYLMDMLLFALWGATQADPEILSEESFGVTTPKPPSTGNYL